MEKLNLKTVIFCLLSAFIGIIIGYYCGETTQIIENDDTKLLIGTYQDYVDTNNQLISLLNDDIKNYDVYKELTWLEDIINNISYPDLKSDNEILEDYYNYYYSTENLLDSLYEWQEDYWLDQVFETDVYYEYILFRDEVNYEH